MEEKISPFVVGVRFSKVGKVYHFSANDVADIKVSDMVVVETSRGWQLGQVAQVLEDAERPPDGWKPIDRRATPRDLLLRQMWQMKESEVVEACRTRVNELRLHGVKIVSAEYSFDGARLMVLFSTETEEKYDLKSLRQDMQKQFGPSQVELRQVGPRDVAKVHCGMGACGLETRCCCLFLTEFSSISIKMAKEQGISLTPSEITGMCGRLRCCLIYEYDTYVDARAKLPRRNKRVRTPQGEGKVVDIVPLRDAVIVEIPEVGHKEFPASEIVVLDDNAPPSAETPALGARPTSEISQPDTGQTFNEESTHQANVVPQEKKPIISAERERTQPDRRSRFQKRPQGSETREIPSKTPDAGTQEGKKDVRRERNSPNNPGSQPPQRLRNPDNRQPRQQPVNPSSQPKPETGGGSQPRNERDYRRKRGRRRDNNDTTPI